MRPTRLTTKSTVTAALSLALGAAVVATSLPARAEEDVSIDRKILRGILEGLGLRKDGEAINYQERAPLVIPQGRTLPPPENSNALAVNNPAWPKDPDIARRKVEAEQERNRNISDEREREQNPLRPDQMTPGGNPNTPPRQSASSMTPNTPTPGDRSTPAELNAPKNIFGKIFGKDEPDSVKFTKEPPRTALTEPPPGYQTPSPDQPYGVGKTVTKAIDYKETHGLIDGSR